MKGKTTYYKIINWTRISVKTKQDSRIYFESLVFYSKTMQYVINISFQDVQKLARLVHRYHFYEINLLLNFLIPYQEVESCSK